MATMLIVEDDPAVAQNLQRQFTPLGHTVLACVSSVHEAIAHVQLHRPALVLIDVYLPGKIDVLAAGHAIQAIDDVRIIYFACRKPAQLAEYMAPPVLWYYDVEPMDLEALHLLLARTVESGQRRLRPPVAMRRQQSAAIWRWPRALWEGLEQAPQHARKVYQQVVQLRRWAKKASQGTSELGDAARYPFPEADRCPIPQGQAAEQTSRMATHVSGEDTRHAARSGPRDVLDDIVPPGGGGELGALMRALDWAQTPVGPILQWPQALRTAVSICLNSRFPMVLWWGRPAYTTFYNDAYIPALGRTKHPGWLGRCGRECWREIWETVGPMIDSVFDTGEATWSEDLLLIMDRNLPREEVYFTFSYSPIYVEPGRVGGVFTACTETTERVVGERRLRTLSDLAARTSKARTAEEACQLAWQCLARGDSDVAFALLYLLSADGTQAHLVAGPTGLDTRATPEVIALSNAAEETEGWPLAEVAASGQAVLVTDLIQRFGPLPSGMWPEPATEALVLPLAAPGHGQLAGFLVAGVNSCRVLDAAYRTFFDLVASQIATAIANARAYEVERQRAEALAELDRAKTSFFSNVSHEFRTPLTLLLGPLEDLLIRPASPLAPADRAALEVAHRNGLRLLRLVNTLLDFSRIEAGRVEAVYEPTDLATLTAELTSMFRAAVEHAGLHLVVDCPPLPEPVYVDREMWEKIVLNLLSNAFKFTFDGEIAVSLRWAGDHVELTVRDTGSGIPAEELPHLFQRFHRVRSVRARTYEGTGIGLALVQELVQLHSGTIGVTSLVGQGSTFTVAVPTGTAHLSADRLGVARTLTSTAVGARPYVEEALRWLPGGAEQATALMEERGLEGTQALTGQRVGRAPTPEVRILLADDNADMRDYLRRLLSQHWTVEAVADGTAALAAAKAQVPDLVLADVMMPGLDGFSLLQALRADPRTREVPILLLSARAGEEARIEGLEAGADDYLIKPFSSRELLARVGAHLELARVRREAAERVNHILESITDGFVALDREWRFIYLNRHAESFLQRLGRTRKELIGRSIWGEFPELVGSPFEQHYRRAVAEQVTMSFEAFDPRLRSWFEVHAFPAVDGLSMYFRDITARKRAEAVLAGEKQALQLLTEGETLGTVLAFLVRLIEAQAGDGTLGSILLLEADGRHLRHGAAPSLPAAYTQAIDGLPIGPVAGSCGTAAWRREPVIVQDIATDPLWVEYRALALRHGLRACWATPILSVAGQVLGTFAMYHPVPHFPSADEQHLVELITHTAAIIIERHRAEQALLHQSLLTKIITENAASALFMMDTTGRCTFMNPAGAKMTGYTLAELQGQILHNYLHHTRPDGTPYPMAECPLDRALSENTVIRGLEEVFIRKDGTFFPVRCAASPIVAEGRPVGTVIEVQDVTQQQRAERDLRAALREKEVLLQEVHHRVKNNLQVVVNLLDLQAEVVDDPRVHAALEDSQARLQAMALIHEQLYQGTSLARLDAANYLRRLSTRLFETYGPSDGRITLDLEFEEIALELNVAIPCGLMLNELLSNALKHAFPAGRSGVVAITLCQEPSGLCVLTVRDTGVGLPEGLDIRQTDSLGLQLVSLLIEQLGGTLTLARGGGTSFRLAFPLPQS